MTANSGMNFPAIYTITNTISGKVYVGQSINIRRRWHSHRWHLNKGIHGNEHLQRSWTKYGESSFIFVVAVNLSDIPKIELKEALNKAELDVLSKTPNAYNLMEAARSGIVPSAETRALLSEKRKLMWQDPEYRERRRISHQKACADPELQERRSKSLKIAFSSPEQKERKSQLAKERWAENGALRTSQYDIRVKNWQNPEYRDQQSQSRSQTWADPEVRAKRIAGIKAGHARRKALKNNPPPIEDSSG